MNHQVIIPNTPTHHTLLWDVGVFSGIMSMILIIICGIYLARGKTIAPRVAGTVGIVMIVSAPVLIVIGWNQSQENTVTTALNGTGITIDPALAPTMLRGDTVSVHSEDYPDHHCEMSPSAVLIDPGTNKVSRVYRLNCSLTGSSSESPPVFSGWDE